MDALLYLTCNVNNFSLFSPQDQVNSNVFYQVLSLLNVTSTLLSVYANTVMFRLSNLQLSHVYIRPKFFLLQGCIALESLQRLLIALLVSVGAITCRLPLDVNATASRKSLQWRHNGRDSVSNQPHDCLIDRLFRCRSKKTSKLRVTGLCAGNSPGTGEFPAQMASDAENVPFDDVIMQPARFRKIQKIHSVWSGYIADDCYMYMMSLLAFYTPIDKSKFFIADFILTQKSTWCLRDNLHNFCWYIDVCKWSLSIKHILILCNNVLRTGI